MQNKQIDSLIFIKILGKGSFGEVYLTKKTDSPNLLATKKISRQRAETEKLIKYLKNEIIILRKLNHPNIVKLDDVLESEHYYYIIMEYINGGDLSSCLKKYMNKFGKPFSEDIVKYLMRQIVEAVAYFHEKNVIHRDLKLDNIMVNFNNEADKENLNMMKAEIKIIDFGFATQLDTKEMLARTAVGTALNMDPIVLEKYNKLRDRNFGYGNKVDVWSMGTICYELLVGKPLFEAKTMDELLSKVKKGNIKIPSHLSKEVINFLSNMLTYDSKYRASAKDLLNHPFIRKNNINNADFILQKGSLIYDTIEGDTTNKFNNNNINKNFGAAEKPISEEGNPYNNKHSGNYPNSNKKINNNIVNINNPYINKLNNHYPSSKTIGGGLSFYGQPMSSTSPSPPPQLQRNQAFQQRNQMNIMPYPYPPPGYPGYQQAVYNPPPMYQYGNNYGLNQAQNIKYGNGGNVNNNRNQANHVMKRNKTMDYRKHQRKDSDSCHIF